MIATNTITYRILADSDLTTISQLTCYYHIIYHGEAEYSIMKYIELKEVTTRKGENVRLNYAQQIELIVGEAMDGADGQRQGFDRDTNRKALRVWMHLMSRRMAGCLRSRMPIISFLWRVNQFIWPFADRAFEEFCSSIEDAGKDKPKAIAAS